MHKEQFQPPQSAIRGSWNRFLTDLHLDRVNINPNLLTEVGIALGVSAGFAISQGKFKAALGLLAASGFFDAIDGFVAKKQGRTSEWGAFLDSVGDRVVDLALLTGATHWAHKRGWKRAENLAKAATTASLNVSLTKTIAESEGIRGIKEQSIGSRLPRLITVAALCLFPNEKAWEASLGFLAAASGITGIERTGQMFLSPQDYPPSELNQKRLRMLKKLTATYIRWIGTASLGTQARVKRLSELSLLMANLGMIEDYARLKADLVTGENTPRLFAGIDAARSFKAVYEYHPKK